MFDFTLIARNMFQPVIDMFWNLFRTACIATFTAIFAYLLMFFIRYKINPFTVKPRYLRKLVISHKPYSFIRWLWVDFLQRKDGSSRFNQFGFTIYCGRQGAGKTMAMVEYLSRMRKKYPDCIIVTNFKCRYADKVMKDWRDFMEIRNGTKGVIFAIDEIQSEYSADSWKDFPESLLSEISMQRKQCIKIVATSQVYSRVAKPIREQTFSVVMCRTFGRRWTFTKEYDACEYSTADSPYTLKKKCKPIDKHNFVQSNELRASYDTYEKIERMRKLEFIPRGQRGVTE